MVKPFGPMANKLVDSFTQFDTAARNQLAMMVGNIASARENFFRKFFYDRRTDIDEECGHPQVLDIWDMYRLYKRFSIANRVVSFWPMECWKSPPYVFESDNPEVLTEFEKAFNALDESLREESWSENDDGYGSPIFEALYRADLLSGIGSFGVLLFGFSDGVDLRQPVTGVDPKTGRRLPGDRKKLDLLYIRSFPEVCVSITQWDTDIGSPRYQMPVEYQITLSLLDSTTDTTTLVPENNTLNVHWTRILHIADNRLESDLIGVPRMEPVYNHLVDLRKLYGGSAEMYWRGAFPGYSMETHPNLNPEDIDLDVPAIKDKMENYMRGLQRYIWSAGMNVKALAPQVVDPTPQIERQLDAICVQLNVPKRKFMGTEMGQLASSDDTDDIQSRTQGRKRLNLIPHIVVPFVNRLISVGVLPEPKKYKVLWPGIDILSEKEKVNIAEAKTRIMSLYAGQGIDNYMSPKDFFVFIMNFNQTEVEMFEKNVQEYMEAKLELEVERMDMLNPEPVGAGPGFDGGNPQPNQQVEDSAKPGEGPADPKQQQARTKDKNGPMTRSRN